MWFYAEHCNPSETMKLGIYFLHLFLFSFNFQGEGTDILKVYDFLLLFYLFTGMFLNLQRPLELKMQRQSPTYLKLRCLLVILNSNSLPFVENELIIIAT